MKNEVYLVEDPNTIEVVRAVRDMTQDDQARVLVLVKAIADGSLGVAEANAAAADGVDAVRALADRLAA